MQEKNDFFRFGMREGGKKATRRVIEEEILQKNAKLFANMQKKEYLCSELEKEPNY